MNLEVAVRSTQADELFTDLAELQPFDTVILADVPREHFSDEQIEMLVRNTQNMGSGLVMLGGPNSFGAGGWTNTPIEEAMPVDFQIKNAKVVPVGALAHADARLGNGRRQLLAEGDRPARRSRRWATRTTAACCTGTATTQWLWGRGMLQGRRQPRADAGPARPHDAGRHAGVRVRRCGWRRTAFGNLPDAAVKHMIIISDGDPGRPNYGPSARSRA